MQIGCILQTSRRDTYQELSNLYTLTYFIYKGAFQRIATSNENHVFLAMTFYYILPMLNQFQSTKFLAGKVLAYQQATYCSLVPLQSQNDYRQSPTTLPTKHDYFHFPHYCINVRKPPQMRQLSLSMQSLFEWRFCRARRLLILSVESV